MNITLYYKLFVIIENFITRKKGLVKSEKNRLAPLPQLMLLRSGHIQPERELATARQLQYTRRLVHHIEFGQHIENMVTGDNIIFFL